MELVERVAALERRLAALEAVGCGGGRESESGGGEDGPGEGRAFWALQGLKEELAASDAGEVAGGGVLYTGAVRLATGERYEWQYGAFTDALLDAGAAGVTAGGADDGGAGWGVAAESFAALGHVVRLRLLREILGGRRTAAELAELDGLGTTGQIYHHLRQLTGAGWLHPAGRGRYEVPAARVVPLLVMFSAARP
ncbi:winged helix-turn-helix domain-containing protein [Streptomyces paludis]|uniref:ArsR family transcriptional regulator n=1 Tax=Streptomyces paludis TaxID=2282738 RepID=A0A345HR01_9ACTN|nr:winged helix-turn-helix domain-containing protein [Streptomyces paludis]AXG79125.1 ArsR family transcriptional regulator [Streptomyces paludis]